MNKELFQYAYRSDRGKGLSVDDCSDEQLGNRIAFAEAMGDKIPPHLALELSELLQERERRNYAAGLRGAS